MADFLSNMIAGPVVVAAAGAGGFDAVIADPTFWVAIAFLIFLAIMVWKARKPLLGALDNRAARIKRDLDEAQRLREEAQGLLAEYKRKERDAITETEEMVAHAEEEAKRVRAKAEEDLVAALKRREQQALDRIAQAEAQAVAEVRGVAVDIAIDATRQLLAKNIDSKKAAKLIEDAVKELPKKLH